jgi:hypothetical protein
VLLAVAIAFEILAIGFLFPGRLRYEVYNE